MASECIRLFIIFFRIGLFSIGGGYVMLPMLKRELIEQRGWLTDEELLNYYAIGQSTPGIIAINTATFVGYQRAGILGAVISVLGMVTPSLVIIMSIAAFFSWFQQWPLVQKALAGMRIAVSMLLVYMVYELIRKAVTDWLGVILAITAFVVVAIFGVSPVAVVLGSAVVGLLTVGRYGGGR